MINNGHFIITGLMCIQVLRDLCRYWFSSQRVVLPILFWLTVEHTPLHESLPIPWSVAGMPTGVAAGYHNAPRSLD